MDVKTLINQLDDESGDLGIEGAEVQVFDTSGHKYKLVEVYAADGTVCIDVEREDS